MAPDTRVCLHEYLRSVYAGCQRAPSVQTRGFAPAIVVLRRIERIFPQQPNMSIVRRFADTLTAASASFCQPHIPEVSPLPEPGDEQTEPPPPLELPWAAMHSQYLPDGSRVHLPPGVTRRRLAATHERYPAGVALVVGTTAHVADIPTPLRRCFTAEIAVPALPEAQRELALRHTLAAASGMSADDVRSAAQATAGFLPCDLGAAACDAVLQVMLKQLQAWHKGQGEPVRSSLQVQVQRHLQGLFESRNGCQPCISQPSRPNLCAVLLAGHLAERPGGPAAHRGHAGAGAQAHRARARRTQDPAGPLGGRRRPRARQARHPRDDRTATQVQVRSGAPTALDTHQLIGWYAGRCRRWRCFGKVPVDHDSAGCVQGALCVGR
jgi:hypothetical protein